MRKFLKEFKEFATRGNVIDLAVGVIIGAAFSAIVTGLVNFIIMPLIVWIFPVQDLSSLSVTLRPESAPGAGDALLWQYGSFLQAIINFLIIAIVIFLVLKALMRVKGIGDKRFGKTISRAEYFKLRGEGKTKREIAEIDAKATAEAEEAEKRKKEEAEKNSTEYLLKQIRDELIKQNASAASLQTLPSDTAEKADEGEKE